MKEVKYKRKENSYSPIEQTIISYDLVEEGMVENSIIDRQILLSSTGGGWGTIPDFYSMNNFSLRTPLGDMPYRISPYVIDLIYYRIKSKQVSILNEPTAFTTTEEYEYNWPKLPQKITKSTSQDKFSVVTTMKYSGDYDTSPYLEMKLKNIYTPLVERISYKKNNLNGDLVKISSVLTNYSLFNNLFYKPSTIQTSYETPKLNTEITFNAYDSRGNPKMITTKDDIKTYYLWSYAGQSLIGEIRNAPTLDSAEYAIKKIFGGSADINSVTNKLYLNHQDTLNLRKLKFDKTFEDSQVTTYTYKPLTGISTVTNESGQTLKYNYDDVGRLISISDGNNRVLSTYSYKHKGPSFPDISLDFAVEKSFDITNNPSNFSKTFTAKATGGSAQGFSYKWIHKSPNGAIQTKLGNPVSFYLTEPGINFLTCIVEDVISKNTKEIFKSFEITEDTGFKNIQISNEPESSYRTANADVYCQNDGNITFRIWCSKSDPETRIYIKLGYGELIEVTDNSYSSEVEASFSAGTTYVNLTISGNDPGTSVEIQMISASNNSLGGTSHLWITPN